ncbi:CPBP family intramembrane glutamic endopeptidase [Weissella diestrammenae]|uniref:CPBP family intramembrane glutamic endopeptidase n=1 Tax=Weissella diestrammenae TaxID=1162633 RepID=UPI001FAD45BC|nr:CPBP family intramembrane glutamic endopeptidase [Weissella diestrammenae]
MINQNSNWRISAGFGFIFVIIGLAFDIFIQTAGLLALKTPAKLLHIKENSWLPILTLVIVFLVLLVIAVQIMLKFVRIKAPKTRLHQLVGSKVAWVFKGYGLIIAGSIVLAMLQTAMTQHIETADNQVALNQMATQGLGARVFLILLAIVLAPLLEELIFRGIVMNYFFKDSGWWWTNVLISGVAFGYFHVALQSFQWFAFIQYSIMGIILAVVYKKTHQIQYSMLTHFMNNTIAMIIMFSSLV